LSDEEADGSLRLSLGRPTTADEIEKFKVVFRQVVEQESQIK
jgi:cysteine sulfinate desulfinase/cysteine desulfurase-like protein